MVQLSQIGEPWWDDIPVAIIGGGPSLIGFDFERLRGPEQKKICHVIAVNGSMFDIPWADVGFGIDSLAFKDWYLDFGTLNYPVHYAIDDERMDKYNNFENVPSNIIFHKRRNDGQLLSEDPRFINGGGTSGFGALGFVFLKKAKDIILFGFDYKAIEQDGKPLWHHNDKYYRPRSRHNANWRTWARNFDHIRDQLKKAGVTVINASPDSKISAFCKMPINDSVNWIHSWGST